MAGKNGENRIVARKQALSQRVRSGAQRTADRAESAVDTASTRVGERIGRATDSVSRGTERVRRAGTYLRTGTPQDFSADLRQLIRRHPVGTLAVGLGAGVVLSRSRLLSRLLWLVPVALTAQRMLRRFGDAPGAERRAPVLH